MDPGGGVEAYGGQGNDFLAAGKIGHQNVVLSGGGWNDVLQGSLSGAFNDKLDGGSGDDRLIAGRYTDPRVQDAQGYLIGQGGHSGNYNSLTGGSGYDWFILSEDSYVFIEDYRLSEDGFMITGFHGPNGLQPEQLKVVYFSKGKYGDKTFRIVLDDGDNPALVQSAKVLAEINVVDFDSDNMTPADVINRIQDGLTGPGSKNLGVYLNGTLYNDDLTGTGGKDEIRAWSGDDTIRGGSGDDRLYGGDGHDVIHGEDGNDMLTGGTGHDTLW